MTTLKDLYDMHDELHNRLMDGAGDHALWLYFERFMGVRSALAKQGISFPQRLGAQMNTVLNEESEEAYRVLAETDKRPRRHAY